MKLNKMYIGYLLKTFQKLLFDEKFNNEFIYPTTHDAVMSISYLRRRKISLELKLAKLQTIQQNENYEPDYTQLDEIIPQPVYIHNEKKDIFSETVSNKF